MIAAPVEPPRTAPVPFLDLRAHHEPLMDEFVDAFRREEWMWVAFIILFPLLNAVLYFFMVIAPRRRCRRAVL